MNTPPPALQLKPAGLCFVADATEAAYRAWRMDQTIAFIRVGAFGALFSFFASSLAMRQWSPAQYEILGPHMLGVLVPIYLAGAVFTLIPWFRPKLMWMMVGLFWVGGFASVWLSGLLVNAAGAAVAWFMFTLLYAPLVRIPPVQAIVALLPPLLYLFWMVSMAFANGMINEIDQFSYCGAPALAFCIVIAVCAVMERILRRNYVQAEVIAGQTAALTHSNQVIQRYVPSSVAREIISGNAAAIETPVRRRVTILFADIAGFTDITDRVEPEDLTHVLSQYLAAMTEIVEGHGGTLNEFAGDGLMALFGAPEPLEPEAQASQSVAAALAMQAAMPRLNAGWNKLGLGSELRIRVGINTGMSSVGSYGSSGRMTYTAIGLQTNIAARIEAEAQPGGILLSESTWQLVRDTQPCALQGEVQVKGVHFPVKVYAPGAASD